jgi:hypothetical protein
VRPEIDGIEFIIESATHEISKAGYTTRISAKLKPDQKKGASGSVGTSGTDDGESATSAPAARASLILRRHPSQAASATPDRKDPAAT